MVVDAVKDSHLRTVDATVVHHVNVMHPFCLPNRYIFDQNDPLSDPARGQSSNLLV